MKANWVFAVLIAAILNPILAHPTPSKHSATPCTRKSSSSSSKSTRSTTTKTSTKCSSTHKVTSTSSKSSSKKTTSSSSKRTSSTSSKTPCKTSSSSKKTSTHTSTSSTSSKTSTSTTAPKVSTSSKSSSASVSGASYTSSQTSAATTPSASVTTSDQTSKSDSTISVLSTTVPSSSINPLSTLLPPLNTSSTLVVPTSSLVPPISSATDVSVPIIEPSSAVPESTSEVVETSINVPDPTSTSIELPPATSLEPPPVTSSPAAPTCPDNIPSQLGNPGFANGFDSWYFNDLPYGDIYAGAYRGDNLGVTVDSNNDAFLAQINDPSKAATYNFYIFQQLCLIPGQTYTYSYYVGLYHNRFSFPDTGCSVSLVLNDQVFDPSTPICGPAPLYTQDSFGTCAIPGYSSDPYGSQVVYEYRTGTLVVPQYGPDYGTDPWINFKFVFNCVSDGTKGQYALALLDDVTLQAVL